MDRLEGKAMKTKAKAQRPSSTLGHGAAKAGGGFEKNWFGFASYRKSLSIFSYLIQSRFLTLGIDIILLK